VRKYRGLSGGGHPVRVWCSTQKELTKVGTEEGRKKAEMKLIAMKGGGWEKKNRQKKRPPALTSKTPQEGTSIPNRVSKTRKKGKSDGEEGRNKSQETEENGAAGNK